MLYELQKFIKNKDYRGMLRCFKSAIPAKICSNIIFFRHYHRVIRYDSPELLDEKLLILKDGIYRNDSLITKCTDKYAVRQYIKEMGLGDILNPLIGAYDSVDEIVWGKLPCGFAIKCNHGCGYNIIVAEKNKASEKDVLGRIERWMKEDYSIISGERHYKSIPRKIIVESLIETEDGSLPIDYKFFSSRGKIICTLIIVGRGKKKKRIFVDENFNDLHIWNDFTGEEYKEMRPKSYDKMVEIAKTLGMDFPFVRVDLYDAKGQVIFGELTFTPHGCIHDYLDDKAQKWIGEQIQL